MMYIKGDEYSLIPTLESDLLRLAFDRDTGLARVSQPTRKETCFIFFFVSIFKKLNQPTMFSFSCSVIVK